MYKTKQCFARYLIELFRNKLSLTFQMRTTIVSVFQNKIGHFPTHKDSGKNRVMLYARTNLV